MFIYIDEQSLEIKCLPEAMNFTEVHDLYKSDHSPNKVLWKKWIKYIYYVYRKDGVLSGDLLADKRKEVVARFFTGETVDYFEKNLKLRAVAKLYILKQCTTWEQLFEKWKDDVDQYIAYLTEVPYFRKKKIIIKGKDGEQDQESYEDVPNIEEKVKAQKAIQDLVDTGRKLEENIFKEKKEKRKSLKPLFDQDEFDGKTRR